MLRKLYDKVLQLAGSRHAPWALAIIAFAESSFFPVPPDVMLAPMVAARPRRAFVYAAICTAASVLGGMLGYFIGLHLQSLAVWLLKVTGHPDGPEQFRHWFDRYGLYVILAKGLTPIPYKLVTITAGLARFDFFTFIWASVLTRGVRFFLEATVLKFYGPAILAEVERRLVFYTVVLVLVLVAGVVVLKVVG